MKLLAAIEAAISSEINKAVVEELERNLGGITLSDVGGVREGVADLIEHEANEGSIREAIKEAIGDIDANDIDGLDDLIEEEVGKAFKNLGADDIEGFADGVEKTIDDYDFSDHSGIRDAFDHLVARRVERNVEGVLEHIVEEAVKDQLESAIVGLGPMIERLIGPAVDKAVFQLVREKSKLAGLFGAVAATMASIDEPMPMRDTHNEKLDAHVV